MNKKICAIISNILIICFNVGSVALLKNYGNQFYFYTQDSNMLAGISALLFLIFLLIKKEIGEIPMWVMILKYISVVSLALTLTIVIALLIPYNVIAEHNALPWYIYFVGGSFICGHILNPIVSVISFIFFENDKRYNKKNNIYYPMIFTLIYGVVMLVINYLKIFDGPYFFLRIYNQQIYIPIVCTVVIIVLNYLIAKLLLIQNQKRVPRRIANIKKKIASQ